MDLRVDEATRKELRKRDQEPVKTEEGRATVDRIGAYAFLECSAKTKDGVKEIFETAARAALETPRTNKTFCNLL